jgi:hypothetical protein
MYEVAFLLLCCPYAKLALHKARVLVNFNHVCVCEFSIMYVCVYVSVLFNPVSVISKGKPLHKKEDVCHLTCTNCSNAISVMQ